MGAKKKAESYKMTAKSKANLKLLDPLEAGTVTFASELYSDELTTSFIGSAKVKEVRKSTQKRK